MLAAWYSSQGAARDVLVVGDRPEPMPGPNEVRIRLKTSGINPGDLKKRQNAFGLGMSYPLVIPHSDGAGIIDAVGNGVPASRIGERVWCFGAQSYRPFGTAAAATTVPADQAVHMPAGVDFETAACLGIPGITAHRCVHAGGPVAGKTLLVQGGAGGVGTLAAGLAQQAGARVIATVRSAAQAEAARHAGADVVIVAGARRAADLVEEIRQHAPEGIQHVVEVAFDQNIELDVEVLALGGSIAAYATIDPRPGIPFWTLLFKNARLLLQGSDDFPMDAKREAATAVNALLSSGWRGVRIERSFALRDIAQAHEHAEQRHGPGRVVLTITTPSGPALTPAV